MLGLTGISSARVALDAVEIEKLGKPVAFAITRPFETNARFVAGREGLPDISLVVVPLEALPHPSEIEELDFDKFADDFINTLTQTPSVNSEEKTGDDLAFSGVTYAKAMSNMEKYFLQHGWGDGLPLIPPTWEAVDEMLERTELSSDYSVGLVEPGGGEANNVKKIVDVDQIILAIGQKSDLSFIAPKLPLNTDKRLILVESETQATNIPGVFAGGDITTGSASVIGAIAAGRRTAESIDRYLNSAGEKHEEQDIKTDLALKFDASCLQNTDRVKDLEVPISERMKGIEIEDVSSLDLSAALTEANRCFNCGCFAVNPSDLAPALIVLGAKIVTSKRSINAEDFWAANKGIQSTVLENDEIVTEIQLPKPASQVKSSFIKFALRKSIDFPIVNCAAAIGDKSLKICLNAVFNKPYRVTKARMPSWIKQ